MAHVLSPQHSAADAQTAHLRVPDVLVVGNACIDRVVAGANGGTIDRLGGASAFAAQVAAQAQVQVGMVSAAAADFARLSELEEQERIWLATKRCAHTTTFEVFGTGPGQDRQERVVSAAAGIDPHDIPAAWRTAKVAYVAPILDDCSAAMVASLQANSLVVGAQGWLREVDPKGWVKFATAAEFRGPPANTTAMIFSEADHPDALGAARHLSAQGLLVVVTQSSRGGVIYAPGKRAQRYAAAQATERDSTGAGDCFGIVFALGLAQNIPLKAAAAQAARAAARVVEGPELGTLTTADLDMARKSRRSA